MLTQARGLEGGETNRKRGFDDSFAPPPSVETISTAISVACGTDKKITMSNKFSFNHGRSMTYPCGYPVSSVDVIPLSLTLFEVKRVKNVEQQAGVNP